MLIAAVGGKFRPVLQSTVPVNDVLGSVAALSCGALEVTVPRLLVRCTLGVHAAGVVV